jgi:hypothetical protein
MAEAGVGRVTRRAVAVPLFALFASVWAFAVAPSPKQTLGLAVGEDRVLVTYSEALRYLDALAGASERVTIERIGTSVEGRPMVALAISTPANLARLAELQATWRALADPRTLGPEERERLLRVTPSCALIGAGIHGNEVAGPQAALLLAYRLAAAEPGSAELEWLESTVVLLVPSLNPDGQELIATWYRRYLGTPHEGSPLPGLYHRYAGHDNNRDFVFLTQPESRAVNRLVYHQWRPQLFLDLHQMGMTGPRQFVPPFADPIAPNVHPLVWRMTSHLGTHLALRLEQKGRAGVVSGWTFDANWIGGTRNTGWWKNVFGILTETAGTALGTSLVIDENELRAGGKGLVEYRPQVNFPNPWRGGKWGHADAVAYELDLMKAFVEFAAIHREDALRGVSAMADDAIAKGRKGGPRAWVIRMDGEDPGRARRLANLLIEGGAEAMLAPKGLVADGHAYPPGTVVFLAAQPLRQFVAELLERQRYPEIAPAPDAEILLPYDITAWTTPLMIGVEVERVERSLEGDLVAVDGELPVRQQPSEGRGSVAVIPGDQLAATAVANQALRNGVPVGRLTAAGAGVPAGSLVFAAGEQARALIHGAGVRSLFFEAAPAPTVALRRVPVGVYHPDTGLEDAGWCRFVLEQAGFDVEVINDRAISSGSFARALGILVLPPLDGKTLVEGPRAQGPIPSPPDVRKGIGKDGVEHIKRFVRGGGTVISVAASAEWLAETLELPVSNTLRGSKREEFYSPGALVALAIDSSAPVGWGMPARVAAMIDAPSALQTRPTAGELVRTVVARFPDEPLLLSGWIRGEEKLRRRAAAVEVKVGAGRAVLFSFAPYFRAQMLATMPLFYNAVMLEMMDPPSPLPVLPSGTRK